MAVPGKSRPNTGETQGNASHRQEKSRGESQVNPGQVPSAKETFGRARITHAIAWDRVAEPQHFDGSGFFFSASGSGSDLKEMTKTKKFHSLNCVLFDFKY